MRKELQKIENVRGTFTGRFVRFGKKSGWNGTTETTVLLEEIMNDKGEIVADHLWFNYTKGFSSIKLKPGGLIKFDARVTSYIKGYFGHRWDVSSYIEEDYKLSHPTKITAVEVKKNKN